MSGAIAGRRRRREREHVMQARTAFLGGQRRAVAAEDVLLDGHPVPNSTVARTQFYCRKAGLA